MCTIGTANHDSLQIQGPRGNCGLPRIGIGSPGQASHHVLDSWSGVVILRFDFGRSQPFHPASPHFWVQRSASSVRVPVWVVPSHDQTNHSASGEGCFAGVRLVDILTPTPPPKMPSQAG
jgi:hypothetical protein